MSEIKFNHKAVKKFFKRIRKNADEINKKDRAFWGSLSAIAFRDVIKHFEAERGPSDKWKKWSKIYREHMQSIGKGGNKILQDTGHLRQNVRLADTSSRIRQGQLLYNPAKTKGGFPYAYAHDTGGPKLPQREFMWLSDKALNQMSVIMAEHTLKGI
jgi:hypothetical protein